MKWNWKEFGNNFSHYYREPGLRVYVYNDGLVRIYIDDLYPIGIRFDEPVSHIMREVEAALS